MAEAILLVLWVGTSLFFIWREKKASDDRESHEWWLSEVKECIHSIECEFRRNCQKIVEEDFSTKRTEHRYYVRIEELKDKYKEELTEKVVARMGKYRVKSIPEHVAREYERNISEIAYTFCNFGNFMSER